jgi:FMN phosphatase YigB (HAD superfamily)
MTHLVDAQQLLHLPLESGHFHSRRDRPRTGSIDEHWAVDDSERVPNVRLRARSRRSTIDTIVFDLDHTLFAWTDVWAEATRGMVHRLRAAAPDEERLLDALRDAHRRHQTMEPPTSIVEVADGLAGFDRATLRRAARAYRNAWMHRPLLVRGTTTALVRLARARQYRLIAYSESPAAPTIARLARTGILDAFHAVVCTKQPPATAPRDLLLWDEVRHSRLLVAPWWPKGDPDSLTALLRWSGTSPERTLVVGDHLQKDIAPALAIGADAAWAQYGTHRWPADHRLVTRLAHWL